MNMRLFATYFLIIFTTFFVDTEAYLNQSNNLNLASIIVFGVYHLRFEPEKNGFKDVNAENLSKTLQKLRPHIVAIEFNQDWLDSYMQNKPVAGFAIGQLEKAIDEGEIGTVILPLAKKHGYKIFGIGAESLEEAQKQQKAEDQLKNNPSESSSLDSFQKFITVFYSVVNRDFKTFIDMNSLEYDRLMEIKHRYTEEVKYHYWENRNIKMSDSICKLAKENKSSRIVVVVGSEHGYSLRQKLKTCKEAVLIPFFHAMAG